MKRFVIFLTILIALGGIYNLSTLRDSLRGFLGDTSYRKDDFPNAKKHYENILKNHISPLSPLGERLGVRD